MLVSYNLRHQAHKLGTKDLFTNIVSWPYTNVWINWEDGRCGKEELRPKHTNNVYHAHLKGFEDKGDTFWRTMLDIEHYLERYWTRRSFPKMVLHRTSSLVSILLGQHNSQQAHISLSMAWGKDSPRPWLALSFPFHSSPSSDSLSSSRWSCTITSCPCKLGAFLVL